MLFENYLLLSLSICVYILEETCATNEGQTKSDTGRKNKSKPNIVIIVADDLGFNDVSIHGSNQIPTPNIDALGIFGIQLNRMYVAPMCTPTRSSLMTGKYVSNIGMQHFVIGCDNPYGLGLDQKLLPEYMQKAGYRTSIVGKWHLGIYRKKYTPTMRGFESHFGYLGPFVDYYNHTCTKPGLSTGFDMRKNLTVNWNSIGNYATDFFTDEAVRQIETHDKQKPLFLYLAHLAPHTGNEDNPMQAPQAEIDKFKYIKNEKRRTYAAMVSKLDESVGRVVKALDDSKMLDNTIILFFADNGAPVIGQHSNNGSNYPFRGQKDSPWEGAIRSAAAIWSPLLRKRQRISNQLVHVTDWLPTFAKIAGVQLEDKTDGKNVWTALSEDKESPRRNVLGHYDQIIPYATYIDSQYKYIQGTTLGGKYDYWLGTNDTNEENENFNKNYAEEIITSNVGRSLQRYSIQGEMMSNEVLKLRKDATIVCKGEIPDIDLQSASERCDPLEGDCLFDLSKDPCETTNLIQQLPLIASHMKQKINHYGNLAVPIRNQPSDFRANPNNFNGTWTWWYDELGIDENDKSSVTLNPLVMPSAFISGKFLRS